MPVAPSATAPPDVAAPDHPLSRAAAGARPTELDRLAARLRDAAVRLRATASGLVSTLEHADWHSVAAERCRAVVGAGAGDLLRVAARLDDAADVVARHAATVRDRAADVVADLAGVARAALGWCS